ncbi:RrF2 family transcriptional regulator [Paenibacillus pabuli]|uniref:RrF2 family transcriptional regulator n=1 Tax=Paenibacillus pabuli TaxID=1472 RepID=UPI001FFEA764|nr:Rrf2 family transcriptional regulator [Paenibacillus pabuli]UPK43952.1 Rrf2 family transcriptional regulator [Paenibacillus pabuli]
MKKAKHTCPSNSKAFGLALQALVFMSDSPNRYPSTNIADHLCSEATLIRRILAKLAQENILEVREGRDGGYRMKQPPESVTLADIYMSLQTEASLCEGMLESTGDHSFGVQMHDMFNDITEEINHSVLEILRKYTIADMANRMTPIMEN